MTIDENQHKSMLGQKEIKGNSNGNSKLVYNEDKGISK